MSGKVDVSVVQTQEQGIGMSESEVSEANEENQQKKRVQPLSP
jgi:hypothetical protein